MPVVSGASSPDGAAATCFACAGAGLCMIVLFVSALRSFCADLALAAWDDVDHAPVAKADKVANCQGGMIAAWEQFALRNCDRPGWCPRGPCIDQRLPVFERSRHGTP